MSHVETGLSEGQLNCMLKSDAYTGVSKAANQFNWVSWPHSSRLTNRLHIHTNWWTYRASSVYHSLLYLLDYPLNSPAKQSSFSLDEAMNAFTVMRCFFFVYLFISSWESNHSVHPKANVVLQIFHIPVNLRELSTLLNHSLHEAISLTKMTGRLVSQNYKSLFVLLSFCLTTRHFVYLIQFYINVNYYILPFVLYWCCYPLDTANYRIIIWLLTTTDQLDLATGLQ